MDCGAAVTRLSRFCNSRATKPQPRRVLSLTFDASWATLGPQPVTHRGASGTLLARQRHAYILDRVRADGGVRVADLVRELSVSDMTVRRDLELLHEQGLLEKVHGGATAVEQSAL